MKRKITITIEIDPEGEQVTDRTESTPEDCLWLEDSSTEDNRKNDNAHEADLFEQIS